MLFAHHWHIWKLKPHKKTYPNVKILLKITFLSDHEDTLPHTHTHRHIHTCIHTYTDITLIGTKFIFNNGSCKIFGKEFLIMHVLCAVVFISSHFILEEYCVLIFFESGNLLQNCKVKNKYSKKFYEIIKNTFCLLLLL